VDDLASLATERGYDLFAEDIEDHRSAIADSINGKRVLVIGGAGSIGSATVREIARFATAALHVVDQNENSLAELVRDLRSSNENFYLSNFKTIPLDFGSFIMRRYLNEKQRYDYVLNFAAFKHVRSEKDIYSVLQMLDTNILKLARLLKWLEEKGGTQRYFCVSTDKAANPANLMGASKRLMEHVIFSGEIANKLQANITSARFANVAFSDGSLLYSWLRRLEKRQPLSVPKDTKRFFISLHEAGQICLLASFCTPHRNLLIPRFMPDKDLRNLQSIAEKLLYYFDYKPHLCSSETEAKNSLEADVANGRYPLLLTPLDTSGEKSLEEFIGKNETVIEIGMKNLQAIEYLPTKRGAVRDLITRIEECVANTDKPIAKEEVVHLISKIVPEFTHIDSHKELDARM